MLRSRRRSESRASSSSSTSVASMFDGNTEATTEEGRHLQLMNDRSATMPSEASLTPEDEDDEDRIESSAVVRQNIARVTKRRSATPSRANTGTSEKRSSTLPNQKPVAPKDNEAEGQVERTAVVRQKRRATSLRSTKSAGWEKLSKENLRDWLLNPASAAALTAPKGPSRQVQCALFETPHGQ